MLATIFARSYSLINNVCDGAKVSFSNIEFAQGYYLPRPESFEKLINNERGRQR